MPFISEQHLADLNSLSQAIGAGATQQGASGKSDGRSVKLTTGQAQMLENIRAALERTETQLGLRTVTKDSSVQDLMDNTLVLVTRTIGNMTRNMSGELPEHLKTFNDFENSVKSVFNRSEARKAVIKELRDALLHARSLPENTINTQIYDDMINHVEKRYGQFAHVTLQHQNFTDSTDSAQSFTSESSSGYETGALTPYQPGSGNDYLSDDYETPPKRPRVVKKGFGEAEGESSPEASEGSMESVESVEWARSSASVTTPGFLTHKEEELFALIMELISKEPRVDAHSDEQRKNIIIKKLITKSDFLANGFAAINEALQLLTLDCDEPDEQKEDPVSPARSAEVPRPQVSPAPAEARGLNLVTRYLVSKGVPLKDADFIHQHILTVPLSEISAHWDKFSKIKDITTNENEEEHPPLNVADFVNLVKNSGFNFIFNHVCDTEPMKAYGCIQEFYKRIPDERKVTLKAAPSMSGVSVPSSPASVSIADLGISNDRQDCWMNASLHMMMNMLNEEDIHHLQNLSYSQGSPQSDIGQKLVLMWQDYRKILNGQPPVISMVEHKRRLKTSLSLCVGQLPHKHPGLTELFNGSGGNPQMDADILVGGMFDLLLMNGRSNHAMGTKVQVTGKFKGRTLTRTGDYRLEGARLQLSMPDARPAGRGVFTMAYCFEQNALIGLVEETWREQDFSTAGVPIREWYPEFIKQNGLNEGDVDLVSDHQSRDQKFRDHKQAFNIQKNISHIGQPNQQDYVSVKLPGEQRRVMVGSRSDLRNFVVTLGVHGYSDQIGTKRSEAAIEAFQQDGNPLIMNMEDKDGESFQMKARLKSLVCHKGPKATFGHYITVNFLPDGRVLVHDDSRVEELQAYLSTYGYAPEQGTLKDLLGGKGFTPYIAAYEREP